MGITKTDFMRGMQCPRMLWLDKHHPELKIIPPETRERLNRGNEFGDAMMGILGPYVEVREYCAGTTRPNKKEMVRKTKELLAEQTPIICEAAFMDADGNYCAADILKYEPEDRTYDLYEVKNSPHLGEQFIRDAGYQARLIRSTGLPLRRVFIIYHAEEPCTIEEVTEQANAYAGVIDENLDRLIAVKLQKEEVLCPTGPQCAEPYDCWYVGYCGMKERGELDLPRCAWCNPGNPLYVSYHDHEWGVPCHDDGRLYELLILESFQAGLSWETILNKRENFRAAFGDFDPSLVASYGEADVERLMGDKGIVRNRKKILSAIRNSRVFLDIQAEFGSFDRYLSGFTGGEIICESDPAVTTSPLSDSISKDLRRRGMDFVGSTIIYAYLQAIGVINAHSPECFLHTDKDQGD